MNTIPPTLLIEDTDFHNAWARAVRYLLRDGRKMTIGDASEPKPITDACVLFELTGDAIRQIEDRELHPQFPFRHVDQYCVEFTRDYLSEYYKKPKNERFSYLYLERLTYGNSDQLTWQDVNLRNSIISGISTNRIQSTTWIPDIDKSNGSSPCLQRVWIRHLGDQNVEVHLTWRSRDLYTAWQANIIALIDMLNREVIHPNNCKIVKLVDYSDSLHIYESDISDARGVKLVPTSPMTR